MNWAPEKKNNNKDENRIWNLERHKLLVMDSRRKALTFTQIWSISVFSVKKEKGGNKKPITPNFCSL